MLDSAKTSGPQATPTPSARAPGRSLQIEPILLIAEPSADYELLDSGDGEKLERYGSVRLRRPDPQALWPRSDATVWQTAHATFVREGRDGRWKFSRPVPETWNIQLAELAFHIRPNAFKHTGIFPEQLPNWNWTRAVIRQRLAATGSKSEPPSVLNLFGYTGGATLACAQAGARVCHVDASKTSVGWAKENARLSRLADAPIRWICDDARAFVKRELRRGNRYDAIIMDPPAFGRGPDGDVWEIENDFLPLMADCHALLSDSPLFCIANGYASGYSQLAYRYNLEPLLQRHGGTLESGELTLREQAGNRLLPCGIFARWMERGPAGSDLDN